MFTITKKRNLPIKSFLESDFFHPNAFNTIFNELDSIESSFKSNIIKKEGYQEIQIAIPGVDKSLINISIDNFTLNVKCEAESDKNNDLEDFCLREFSFSSFNRSFKLPKDSDLDKITSRYKNGILYIKVPFDNSEKFKKRTISIK